MMQVNEMSQTAVQSGLNDSGRMIDLKNISSTAAANFVNSTVPILLGASDSVANSLQYDNQSLLYPHNYVPLYASAESATHFYSTQSNNQQALYQPGLNSPPSNMFSGAVNQPFMTAVSSNQPVFAGATSQNQPPYASVNQPFTGGATNPHELGTPFGVQHNAMYGAYGVGVDGNAIFAGYDPAAFSNGASNFTDSSINYLGDQLAKTGLSEDGGYQNGGCGQFGPIEEQTANYGGYASDMRRRRAAPTAAGASNGNSNGADTYFARNARRFAGYRPSAPFGGDRSRLRQFDSVPFRVPARFGPPASTQAPPIIAKRPQSAAVFSESDFPSLNDALRTPPKTSNGKPAPTPTKNDEAKRAADENANDRRSGSSDGVDSATDEKSGTESDERCSPKPVRRPNEPDSSQQADIDRAVGELVSRLRPLVQARCARRFEDCNPSIHARFFIVKSNSEDDVYRSLKYSIWCSTPHGNARLQRAFSEQLALARNACGADAHEAAVLETALRDFPVILYFSVNGSGHFCGVACMRSAVDMASRARVWVSDRFTGRFDIEWLYVKDIPNAALRHIRVDCPPDAQSNTNATGSSLESSYGSPFGVGVGHKVAFTHQRDCTEIGRREALEALRVVHEYESQTTIFDDARFYEERERGTQHAHPEDEPLATDNKGTAAPGSSFSGHNSRHANGLRATNGSVAVIANAADGEGPSKTSYAKVVNGCGTMQSRNYANAVVSGPSPSCKTAETDAAAAPIGPSGTNK